MTHFRIPELASCEMISVKLTDRRRCRRPPVRRDVNTRDCHRA